MFPVWLILGALDGAILVVIGAAGSHGAIQDPELVPPFRAGCGLPGLACGSAVSDRAWRRPRRGRGPSIDPFCCGCVSCRYDLVLRFALRTCLHRRSPDPHGRAVWRWISYLGMVTAGSQPGSCCCVIGAINGGSVRRVLLVDPGREPHEIGRSRREIQRRVFQIALNLDEGHDEQRAARQVPGNAPVTTGVTIAGNDDRVFAACNCVGRFLRQCGISSGLHAGHARERGSARPHNARLPVDPATRRGDRRQAVGRRGL